MQFQFTFVSEDPAEMAKVSAAVVEALRDQSETVEDEPAPKKRARPPGKKVDAEKVQQVPDAPAKVPDVAPAVEPISRDPLPMRPAAQDPLLKLARERGVLWVRGVLDQYGVAKLSELDDSQVTEIIDAAAA